MSKNNGYCESACLAANSNPDFSASSELLEEDLLSSELVKFKRPQGSTTTVASNLKKIAIFYDGNYFNHVMNYYKFQHRARLNLHGLHDFIRLSIAKYEEEDPNRCAVVEKHYFRGILSGYKFQNSKMLNNDRHIDKILTEAGITPHYYPMDVRGQKPCEKGVDVGLALEAFDLALQKQFNIIALIAGDGDYVPLVQKLHKNGVRVVLFAWNFERSAWVNEKGRLCFTEPTNNSFDLIKECSYRLMMTKEIESLFQRGDSMLKRLFH